MRPGDRVAVAVSGGADSVGLLRVLLELRSDLGIVLSIAHFHHGIRGVEADADENFVADLATAFDLEFHWGRGNARAESAKRQIGLEAASRSLRHAFFERLLEQGKVNIVATAHTLDDQAETVLMKLLRGAGTRGLAGIFPERRLSSGRVVRPLLEIRRDEIREYLRELKQPWREDLSNSDVEFTRNRIRANIMPLLRELNPSVEVALAHAAEIARAENQYWDEQTARLLPMVVAPGEPARGGGRKQTSAEAFSFDIQKFEQFPLTIRRRLLLRASEQLGCGLDFDHLKAILDLLDERRAKGARNRTIEIAHGWRARLSFRELRIERFDGTKSEEYEHVLPVPGEVPLAALGIIIRARINEGNGITEDAGYNRAHSLSLRELSGPLIVRNWRAGDRFQPLRHRSEKRLKELLYPLHLPAEEKRLWPVVVMGDRIVWVRGVDSPTLHTKTGHQVRITEESVAAFSGNRGD